MGLFKLLSVMSLNKTGLLTIFVSLAVLWFSGLWSVIGGFVVAYTVWAAVILVFSLAVAVISVFLYFFVAENCEDGVFSPALVFYGSTVVFNLASLCFVLVVCQIISHISVSLN
jgi:hypothetical protein